MAEHKHRAVVALSGGCFPWTACVAPDKGHSEASHGNIVERHECRCGAYRLVEVNYGHRAYGPWQPYPPAEPNGYVLSLDWGDNLSHFERLDTARAAAETALTEGYKHAQVWHCRAGTACEVDADQDCEFECHAARASQ